MILPGANIRPNPTLKFRSLPMASKPLKSDQGRNLLSQSGGFRAQFRTFDSIKEGDEMISAISRRPKPLFRSANGDGSKTSFGAKSEQTWNMVQIRGELFHVNIAPGIVGPNLLNNNTGSKWPLTRCHKKQQAEKRGPSIYDVAKLNFVGKIQVSSP